MRKIVAAVGLVLAAAPWRVEALPLRSPHTMEACLECHRTALTATDKGTVPFIIVPEGSDPHRVVQDQCKVCHQKPLPAFWLMLFPGRQKTLESAAPPASETRASSGNPHDGMDCGDCHRGKVRFGQTTGAEKDLVDKGGDISDFCSRCHDDIVAEHFPRNNIPLGSTTCLSCHLVHGSSGVPPLLRADFYTFIRETTQVNPHGGAPFCFACHPNKPLPGETPELLHQGEEQHRLCTRCHTQPEHHVTGKGPGRGTWKMEFLNYPLQGGRITCVTCHVPHGVGDRQRGVSRFSLRGEPYPVMGDFCLKCHEKKDWSRLNAHDQITAGGGIIGRTCIFCHDGVPEVPAKKPLTAADFNDSLTAVCTQCHETGPHPDVDHLVVPSRKLLDNMQEFEGKREVRLPLDFDGSITCVTCHNPHERGLLTGPDSVGADEEHRIRLTTFNEICTPCHGRK
jgi:hypothetical protein